VVKYKRMLTVMLAVSVLLVVVISVTQAYWVDYGWVYLGKSYRCLDGCGIWAGQDRVWEDRYYGHKFCWDDGTGCYMSEVRTESVFFGCGTC
jgi:hypothetical protein